ncbi:MAG: exo-alpha-sialidase [Planctomycetes bacterium]|nr:exo-alpha-sialidase [Planctomycetota bacterium]
MIGHLNTPGSTTHVPWIVTLLLAATAHAQQTAPRIELAEFRIAPMELQLGESFTIHARAAATGVKLGSFLLRTADDVAPGDTIPGFPLYANGKRYMVGGERYFLFDNGQLDGNPEDGAFTLEISTRDWKEGTRVFAFFASCRPNQGPFVAARHDFAVLVEKDRVLVEDLGGVSPGYSRAIATFDVKPTAVRPGESVNVSLETRSAPAVGVELTNPFHIDAADTLSGFHYDAAKKKSFFGAPAAALVRDNHPPDRDADKGRLVLQLDTRDWPPGVHHFTANLVGRSGKPLDHRSFGVKVIGPDDRLEVTVGESYYFAPGTHFGRFAKLADGALLCEDRRSHDGGRTWEGPTGGFGVGAEQLADGSVLGLEYRCFPVEGEEGRYQVERSLSTDGGHTFEKSQADVWVPEATAAMGHGPHVGPLFMRSVVQRPDGSLAALCAGWFKSDKTPCPYGRGRPYSRTYICESDDAGCSWRYLTTIGYDEIGSEGYNEGSMRRLPNGEILAVLRTGNERDFNCQDNPIMWATSRDEGRTWSPPRRTGLEGAYPSLAVLEDGLVAITYGRPGAMIAFSTDAGRTWADRTAIDATPYSGYTDVVPLAPGEVLVGFGAKDYLDPKTHQRQSQLRLARVRYRRLDPQ